MDKLFSIYRSSAGSGKTRTLAKEYLKLALRYKADYFKHILAVTFTNKASQEMKSRILDYLDAFAKAEANELAAELRKELNQDDQTFQQNSQSVQAAILHQYSQFSISTIDAFFQKVIRSFTRESGLIGDYRLEVDHDTILEEVVDNLIDELGSNKQLTEWVVEFAKENLENEKAWDVRYNLIQFAREIFREEFKLIEDEIQSVTSRSGYFVELKNKLWQTKSDFITKISPPAKQALSLIESKGWTQEDFSYGKNSGLLSFLKTFAFEKNLSEMSDGPGKRIRDYFTEGINWPNKKSPHKAEIHKLAESTLAPIVREIVQHYDGFFESAFSAEVALKNLYVFGLIADIARKLKEYKDENNIMLLADAPKFLQGIIQDSDTPFIYEKVGSFYRNYLIDEFQDTSGLQWKNFQPLIMNSLDQGYPGLVVGDVKQAIYRWRGGDLNLLQNDVSRVIGNDRVEIKELDKNFRSSKAVVDFNNALFQAASTIVSMETNVTIATDAYRDGSQKPFKELPGFVEINFIEDQIPDEENLFSKEGDTPQSPMKWNELALGAIPAVMEKLQQHGAALKDIAILVRKNEEGQRIATHLLQYKNSDAAKAGISYDVVSNESLRIDGAASVNLLLGAMRYLLNPEDSIARAQLSFEYAKLHFPKRTLSEVFTVANQVNFENQLPENFANRKTSLRKLALIELTESLIEIFDIGKIQGELVHLQAFQDLVLDFSTRERNDLGAFLEWWELNRNKKSVQISGDVNAAQILTIHKSKGLQFKYVIIPFCSWGLDHESWQSPNLWVKSHEEPFNDAGYIPVRYGSSLEKTFFRSYYEEEHTKTFLDNLNLLYVAATRAENGLIIMAPHPDAKGAKNTIGSLLYKSLSMSEDLNKNWRGATLWSSSEEWPTFQSTETNIADAVSLVKYQASSWRDKLVIRHTGSKLFTEEHADLKLKIDYGLHMHNILSRMKYSDEFEITIEKIRQEGLITVEEKKFLEDEWNELLQIKEVASWFSREWEVYTEIPILKPDGSESRLDRLLTRDKRCIIIDFKTGTPNKTDDRQVNDYMKTLREMNYIDVKGYLLYLKSKEIVEVKAGMNHKLPKKPVNKDQLTLGL